MLKHVGTDLVLIERAIIFNWYKNSSDNIQMIRLVREIKGGSV